jgi:hypothetical protein
MSDFLKNCRFSNKLNDIFKERIKLTFISHSETILITKEDEVSKFDNFNDCPFVGLSNDDPQAVINSFKFNELYDKILNR